MPTGAPSLMGTETPATGGTSDSSVPDTAETKNAGGQTEGAITKPDIAGKTNSPTPAVTAKPEAPAYAPNFKFKVLDKEKEFDEWIRPLVKDADTEKKVKELYEKAYGLDSVKQDRETLRSELSQAKEKMASTDKAIQTISDYAGQKDWDSFFEALSIPKNEILKYALDLVQREQMPPEQKAQWEAGRRTQQEAKYYQEQNRALQEQQRQFSTQQREWELSQELSKPEVSSLVEAYNAGMANPSAFRDKVILIGQAYAAKGIDLPAQAAIQEAVKELRAINPQLGGFMAQAQEAPKVVQPSTKPTLPNIQGRGTSPVKSTVRSLDDLRNLAKSYDQPY